MSYKKISLIIYFNLITFISFSQIIEKEISIYAQPDSLYGTILISPKSKYLCIIHAGSGPTDRNGNNEYGGENNSLKKLAEELSKSKISVFRYDKRGIGKSKNALKSEDSLSIYNYVNDLLKWIEYFSNPPYNYKKFILIGHSEGGLITTMASEKEKKISKLVLLASAGYRADTLLKRQLSYLHENAKKVIFPLIDTFAKGYKVENIPPMLSMFFRESIQNYLISWFAIDPAIELSKIKIPTLIIQGDNDFQVSVDNAERLKSFKKDAELKIIPHVNHVLVEAPKEKKANMDTYNQPELPISKLILDTIIEFIQKNK